MKSRKFKHAVALCLTCTLSAALLAGCGPSGNTSKGASSSGNSASSVGNSSQPVSTQYPDAPISCIVPYAAGGGSDTLTRTIMKVIKLPNNGQIVAVNVEGASGYTGCLQAAKSDPDGYTILAHNPMDVVGYTLSQSTDEALYQDMALICTVVDDYGVILTNKDAGFKSLDEVAACAKENPGAINLGTTGVNSINFADTLRILRALDIEKDITVVPYDSGNTATTALLGNQIQLLTMSVADTKSYVESGDFTALVVIGDHRASALPDTPCTVDLGMNDITTTKPRGYYAPAGTPQEIIDILADAMEEATKTEDFQAMVETYGWEINFKRADEIQPQIEQWAKDLMPVFEEIMNG